jgi:hypothetical protein
MAVSSFSQDKKGNVNEAKAGTANEAKGKVQELASSAAEKAQEVASDVSHKAQEWASTVANKPQEVASAAVDKTNDGIAAAGHQMAALGDKVRAAAPRDGVLGSAATTVADNLQAGGHYLEQHGLQDMGHDLTALVRHYPIQAVLAGFGLGCLLGMTVRGR